MSVEFLKCVACERVVEYDMLVAKSASGPYEYYKWGHGLVATSQEPEETPVCSDCQEN